MKAPRAVYYTSLYITAFGLYIMHFVLYIRLYITLFCVLRPLDYVLYASEASKYTWLQGTNTHEW